VRNAPSPRSLAARGRELNRCGGKRRIPMSVARDLAEFLTPYRAADLPAQTVEYAAMLIASTIASAAMGSTLQAAQIIRDLASEQMTHAVPLAATSAGGLVKAADTSTAREYHAGLATVNGIQAARAAERGYRAEERILEMPLGFFEALGGEDGAAAAAVALRDLGQSWDIVTDMAVKLVPGGPPS